MTQNNDKVNAKEREAALISAVGDIPEIKKPWILSLIHDFVEIETRCAALEGLPTFEVDVKNPKRQRKLPAHDMLKEWQQRKTETTRALLRAIDVYDDNEPSALEKILKNYETR